MNQVKNQVKNAYDTYAALVPLLDDDYDDVCDTANDVAREYRFAAESFAIHGEANDAY